MKFCAVLGYYPKDVPGGAEYQAYLLGRELSSRGHETHYVAHQSDEDSVVTDEGVRVHRRSDPDMRSLVDDLAKIDADVYYFRLAPDLPLVWLASRRLDATLVYNVSRDAQCRPLFAPGPYGSSKSAPMRTIDTGRYALYRFLLRTPDVLFAQTEYQQQLLREHRGLESTVIGNGHPIPPEREPEPEPPIVLWLANLKAVKRPEAFLRIAEVHRDLPCRFWMVGHPVDDALHDLVREAEREQENLTYHGGCDLSESEEYFEQASVFVHTGDAEGFPNTFLQAWMHEAPVVSLCTDIDGALADHGAGVHCPTIEAARETVGQLVSEPTERAKLAATAREFAIEHHSIGAVVDRVEDRLEPLVD